MPFEGETSKRWRGCLFVLTGQEHRVASAVEARWPGVKARAVTAMKRRSQQGVKHLAEEVIIPSYVFFEADEDFIPSAPFPEGLCKVLTTLAGDFKLTGQDDAFARWLLGQDGLLGVSRAHKVGERIVIHQGPLKDLEGHILKIDRRNANGLVQLEVGDRLIKAWLPFEIVESETTQDLR